MDGIDVPPRKLTARVWRVVVLLWLLMALATAAALWKMRSSALRNHARQLDLLSLAVGEHVDRGLAGVEVGVRALRDELAATTSAAELTPAQRARMMPLVHTLWLLDLRGRPVASAPADAAHAVAPPPTASFEPALDALAADTVALSAPFAADAARGDLLGLALRLHEAHSDGPAWLVAGIPTDRLLGDFGHALGAAGTHLTVTRRDGALLSGQRLADGGAAAPFGDDRPRLVSEHQSARFGVKVVVAELLDKVLSEWHAAALLATAVLLTALAAMAAGARFGLHFARRHGEAAAALAAHPAAIRRLEALVTLARGVAHDFNGVLTGIQGWAGMARQAAPAGSDQARHLDKLMNAAHRGRALADRILLLSRPSAEATESVTHVEPVVREVLELLAGSAPPGISFAVSMEAPGARLSGDPNLLFEAVLNLCTNAIRAMPDGGTVAVSLAREDGDAPKTLSHGTRGAGPHVVLTVRDHGPGLAPEAMATLFEPRDATRGEQRRHGLGLVVVRAVVAELQGAIDVGSAAGQGACFAIHLPELRPGDGIPPAIGPPIGRSPIA